MRVILAEGTVQLGASKYMLVTRDVHTALHEVVHVALVFDQHPVERRLRQVSFLGGSDCHFHG